MVELSNMDHETQTHIGYHYSACSFCTQIIQRFCDITMDSVIYIGIANNGIYYASVEWNYLSIPKLQRYNRWSFGTDK